MEQQQQHLSLPSYVQWASRAQAVYYWAHQLMHQDNWCILDTETTGLEGHDEIIELAVINKRGDVVFNSLLKPSEGVRISEGARSAHGMSDELLTGAPSFLAQWPQIYETLHHYERILVYNAPYDSRMLDQSARASNLRLFHSQRGADFITRTRPEGETWTPFVLPVEWQCVMATYSDGFSTIRRRNGEWKFVKLEAACAEQGLELGPQAHRALWDCQATLALIKRLAECYTLLEDYRASMKQQEQESEGESR